MVWLGQKIRSCHFVSPQYNEHKQLLLMFKIHTTAIDVFLFVSSTILTFTLVQCDFGVWISSSHMCISMADYHDWNSNHRTESPYQLMCMYNVKNIHVTLPNSLDLELTGSRYVSAFEHGCFPRPGQWTPRQHFRMQQPSAMTTWFWNCWNTLDTRTDLRFFFQWVWSSCGFG